MSMREKMRGDFISRMHRYPQRGWIAGVCAGLAEYFDWNVKLVRVLFLLALIFGGGFPMIVIYCVLWYVMDAAADENAPQRTNTGAATAEQTPADLKSRFARIEQRLGNVEECVVSRDFELRQELRKLEG